MRISTALVVIVVSVCPAAAQPSPSFNRLLERFEPYLRLVQQYRDSDDARATQVIKEFSERPRNALEDAVDTWKDLILDPTRGFDAVASQRSDLQDAREARTLEAAALLHTVAGIIAYERSGPSLLQFHLAMARRLSAMRGSPSATTRTFDADWNRLVAVFFHGQWMLDEAWPYIEAALTLSSTDGELLVAAGRVYEARHTYRMMQLARRHDPGATQSPKTIQEEMLQQAGAKADIARAETLLRSARMSNAGGAATRLRLGRVLQAAGRVSEAETELRAAIAESSGDATAYLARVFLARMLQDRGTTSEARALYEAATRVRPRNQAARIGLARLLAEAGRRDEAGNLALAVVTTDRQGSDEPWWLYYYPDEHALSVLVAGMRERLR